MPYDIIIGRDASDKEKFGDRGLVFIGKGFVKMGQYTSLSNRILMDVARSHVVLVAGKRGSGKSYTLGTIAEELTNLPQEISQNIASLIFDTMGIYWTMKFRNEKDRNLLQEWGLKTKSLKTRVFVPYGHYNDYIQKGVPVDESFALDITELNPEDWIITFELDMINPISVLIERTITGLRSKGRFGIGDIIDQFKEDDKSSQEIKNAAISLFEAARTWGVFSEKGKDATQIKDLISSATTSVLDLSVYNSIGTFDVRALVISLICRKIFNERMDARKKEEVDSIAKGANYLYSMNIKDTPLTWIFIDEAHEFLPLKGKTAATDALVQLLREGRQPGVSLVLATQQPGQIHKDVMTQSDIVISHRVTAKPDLDALGYIMQSYLTDSIKKYMDDLPSLKGSAIILDDNSERIYPMRVRPRFTWHGGEAPTAISTERESL
ncbi:MAG: ATP-binding protein [Candidatus Nanoarchaeia archaeon]